MDDLGAVLFVIDAPDGARRALYGIYVQRAEDWEEEAGFGAPWPVAVDEEEHDSYVVARASICWGDRSAVVFVAHVAPP